ncbi:hypothetical protein DPMN_084225 [Dreissena polymorpha]|uniref:Uncharacterized protein n=1 Tax=Dreissena polymorpha TaxID=45954 RepID=A0A9D3YDX9_DREPO|nr:hypothetical protein DPMN_084225 [Dreissena polymorpha]
MTTRHPHDPTRTNTDKPDSSTLSTRRPDRLSGQSYVLVRTNLAETRRAPD